MLWGDVPTETRYAMSRGTVHLMLKTLSGRRYHTRWKCCQEGPYPTNWIRCSRTGRTIQTGDGMSCGAVLFKLETLCPISRTAVTIIYMKMSYIVLQENCKFVCFGSVLYQNKFECNVIRLSHMVYSRFVIALLIYQIHFSLICSCNVRRHQ